MIAVLRTNPKKVYEFNNCLDSFAKKEGEDAPKVTVDAGKVISCCKCDDSCFEMRLTLRSIDYRRLCSRRGACCGAIVHSSRREIQRPAWIDAHHCL